MSTFNPKEADAIQRAIKETRARLAVPPKPALSPEPQAGPPPDRATDDLLNGARAIADFLGVHKHQVYYMARMKYLPIGRLGKTMIASRSGLRRALKRRTSETEEG